MGTSFGLSHAQQLATSAGPADTVTTLAGCTTLAARASDSIPPMKKVSVTPPKGVKEEHIHAAFERAIDP
jgi:hypothetical protein